MGVKGHLGEIKVDSRHNDSLARFCIVMSHHFNSPYRFSVADEEERLLKLVTVGEAAAIITGWKAPRCWSSDPQLLFHSAESGTGPKMLELRPSSFFLFSLIAQATHCNTREYMEATQDTHTQA